MDKVYIVYSMDAAYTTELIKAFLSAEKANGLMEELDRAAGVFGPFHYVHEMEVED